MSLFLAAVMIAVTLAGWALGTAIRLALPLDRRRCGSLSNARYGWRLSRWPRSPLAIESVRAQTDRGDPALARHLPPAG